MRRKIGVLALVLVAAGAGLSVRARAAAQAARATDQDVLPALLIEVRGLRAAMEQMASAASAHEIGRAPGAVGAWTASAPGAACEQPVTANGERPE